MTARNNKRKFGAESHSEAEVKDHTCETDCKNDKLIKDIGLIARFTLITKPQNDMQHEN